MTKLGFGAWGSAFPDKLAKDAALKTYKDWLLELAEKHQSWLHIRHPDFELFNDLLATEKCGTWTPNSKFDGWKCAEYNYNPFGKPESWNSDANYKNYPLDSTLLVVNAWDDRSFVGNGGSHDNTLDGWVVAGGTSGFHPDDFKKKPLGVNMVNSAYLHNIFFSPSLGEDVRQTHTDDGLSLF